MYTKDDINYFNSLRQTNPDLYEHMLAFHARLQADISKGCHDLRNIVALIGGSYQLIEHENPSLADNKRWIQMGGDIDQLTSALNSIGEYRYAAVLRLRETDVCEYLWQLHEELTSGDGSPDLAVSIPPALPSVTMDPDKISYVIRALIANITDIRPDAPIILSADCKADRLYIHIADELDEFDAKTNAAMFELFNTSKQNHIGLSLATSYRILLAHKGELLYRTNTPCGSIFTLMLPLVP